MSVSSRDEETLGGLDARLMALETSNKFQDWFGKHPGIVLATLFSGLCGGAWVFHTWEIERIDSRHKLEVTRLENRNVDKIKWLKEQHTQINSSNTDKCNIEKERINNKLAQCSMVKTVARKNVETAKTAKGKVEHLQ